ncbi:MAG: aminotransferase class IV, partial [Leptospiraceae bacterium]|nr:aminotransferase class IV [Leptospiraceae bacterium]
FFYELKNRINRILKENEVNDGKLRLVVFLEKDKSLSSILFTDTIKKFPDSISLYISSYKKPFPPIFPSFVKITSNLTSHLSANEAKENGFDEGIILDTKDQITEGSYCNLFFQKGDKFYTPSNELAILDGVTRSKIIETLNTLKIQIIENALDKNFIFECDYAYISSSSRGLLPVNKINNRIFDINRSSLISSIKREYENLQESSISKW